MASQKYSSAWIEARVEIVRPHLLLLGPRGRGPCAILNEILTGCLADAFHNGGVSNGLVDSEPDSACEYRYACAIVTMWNHATLNPLYFTSLFSVVVQRSIPMEGARCSVITGDGTVDYRDLSCSMCCWMDGF